MRYFILTSMMFFLFSCSSETNNPLLSNDDENSELLGKKVKTYYTVAVVKGDFTPTNVDALLLSSCDGNSISTNYAVNWEKGSTCIEITPDGGPTLSDDPAIYIRKKRGQIVSIGLAIQDVEGPDGMLYTASKIAIDPPVTPSETGFTIPVRTNGIEVWKHKKHIGGPPVEMVGYISIGDIVYTPITP